MDVLEACLLRCDRDTLSVIRKIFNTIDLSKNLEGHELDITYYSLSHDESMIVTGSEDRTVKIWDIETGECLKTLGGHTNDVTSCSFSPNDKMIVSCCETEIRLWNPETGECVKTMKETSQTFGLFDEEEDATFIDCIFSQDGGTIISCSSYREIRYWDVNTGECIRIIEGIGSYCGILFSHNRNLILICTEDADLSIQNIAGKYISKIQNHGEYPPEMQFSPDDEMVMICETDEPITLWDTQTGEFIKCLGNEDTPSIDACSFYSKDKKILAYLMDGTIRTWDIETGKCVEIVRNPDYKNTDPPHKCTLFCDDKMLINLRDGKELHILDLDWCRRNHRIKA